jgi:hypothetical protein
MASDVGQQFVKALARKDATELKALLRPDVNFRAMTPRRFWEAEDPDTIVDEIILGTWFGPTDEITEVVDIETSTVASRERVGYRLGVTNPTGSYVVEQQAYFDVNNGQISWLRIMCAGYLPAS